MMQNQTTPTTQHDANVDAAAKPLRALSWYDYLWSSMPVSLLFTGGKFGLAGNLLGALVGVSGVLINLRILRGQRGTVLRYLLPFLATIGAFVVFAILITLFQAFTQKL